MFKKILCILLLFSATVISVILAGSCGNSSVIDLSESPGEGFVPLFNGKDFTGWDITPDKGTWVVENGMMHCKGSPRTPYLIRTEKEYENFEFWEGVILPIE